MTRIRTARFSAAMVWALTTAPLVLLMAMADSRLTVVESLVITSSRATTTTSIMRRGRHHHHSRLFGSGGGGGSSFLKQKPGESDMDFFRRIQATAGDPIEFERMALNKNDKKITTSQPSSSKSEDSDNNGTTTTTGPSNYQSAEDWDAEVKAKKAKGEFTWEEKVQFDGQRHGNQFNQNEILRKNLHSS